MPLVDRLERKYGWIAIPGIIRILVGFQLLMFLLTHLRQDIGLVELLSLDPGKIVGGEVWRLVSFTILPPTLSLLLMVIMAFFTIFLGEILERMWGSFRLTLYVFGGIIGILVGSFLAYYAVSPNGFWTFYGRTNSTGYIWVTMLLLAVAVLEPNLTIRAMLVIPIKIMWLAIFDGGIILLDLIRLGGEHILLAVALLLAISNFLIVFGPTAVRNMRQRCTLAARRHRFESAKISEDEALHRCHTCGMTEQDDEELEFRVAADGEEYCSDHLPGKSED